MMLMLLAALAVFQADEPRREIGPATERTFVEARAALDSTLLDYPSARFREVRAHELGVCGEVNAKNRMGAYSGWTKFVVALTGDEPVARVGDDEVLVDALCGPETRPQSPDYSDRLAAQR